MYSQLLRDDRDPDPDPNLILHNDDQSGEDSLDEEEETVVAADIHYMLIDREYECIGEKFTLPTDDYIVSDEDLIQRLLTVMRDEQELIFGQ